MTLEAVVGIVNVGVQRLPRRREYHFEEIPAGRPRSRKIEYRMEHPQRQARLLQIGKAEAPAQILRIDDVADPERNRFAPGDDLSTHEGRKRSGRILPPYLADTVLIVEVVGARGITCRPVDEGITLPARLKRIGRFVDAPKPQEEFISLIEIVVDIELEQILLGGQRVIGRIVGNRL